MLYIDANNWSKKLRIPRSVTRLPKNRVWRFVLKNTVRRRPIDFIVSEEPPMDGAIQIQPTLENTRQFHELTFPLIPAPKGEYQYSLICNAGIVASGLLMVTENDIQEEHNESVQYEQYE